MIDEAVFLLYNTRMERKTPHIVYTERIEPKRRVIRTDGALYVVLLLGAIAAIFLSRFLANRLHVNMLLTQIGLYLLLLGVGYWIYCARLTDFRYELYDTELNVIRAVGSKEKTIVHVPLDAVTEIGEYRNSDAKPELRAYHGAKEKTTAVWFTENGERHVVFLNASDTMKAKLSEAAHAEK